MRSEITMAAVGQTEVMMVVDGPHHQVAGHRNMEVKKCMNNFVVEDYKLHVMTINWKLHLLTDTHLYRMLTYIDIYILDLLRKHSTFYIMQIMVTIVTSLF